MPAQTPASAAIIERLRPKPVSEIITTRLARWLIYGRNSSGKTTFLSTIDPEIALFVALVDKENPAPLLDRPRTHIFHIQDWEDLDDILFQMRQICAAMPFGKVAFATDTWSRIEAHALNHVVGRKMIDPTDDKQIEQYMKEGPALPGGVKGVDGRAQWQQIASLSASWMDYYSALPCHVIFLAQESDDRPQFENDILITGPRLRPEAYRRAYDSLTLIGRLYVELDQGGLPSQDAFNREIDPNAKEIRRLLVGAHPRFRAKGDSRKLGYTVENPTWEKLSTTLLNSGKA